MKANMKIYSAILICMSLLYSCSDFLDKMPDNQKTMDMVWESQKETEAYLYNVYSQLPNESVLWERPWVPASDEMDIVWDRYLGSKINTGSWGPLTTYYDQWSNYYNAIRASFVFENNVDKCYELTETLKKQYKAEVKFLRGYYYWLLLRQYGPFILIKEETKMDEDWNKYQRAPYEECVTYICQMMDEAELNLPFSWKSNTLWLGKPDQVVCKAVKSRVLLMAASPQWNGNSDYASFKNLDGTRLVNTTYSVDKWKKAAEAAKSVIVAAESAPKGKEIRLYRNEENGDATFNPFKSVRDVQLKKWNCEIIWGTGSTDPNNLERHCTPRPGGWSGLGPTQRLVNAFYMIDGKTIEDPTSTYQSTGFAPANHSNWTSDDLDKMQEGAIWGHRKGEWNMYANREARFYASILYNGRPLPQVSKADRDVYSTGSNKDGWGRAELYAKGVSGSGSADHSSTGYLMAKFVSPNSNPYRNQWGEWRQYTYIRLAEIYLNYIEALNEYDPTNADIKKYWDMIRDRAGLPSIFETYPEIQGNIEKQREYILRERQIELCFETDRYFTTRRRLLADKTDTSRQPKDRRYGDGGPMFGLNILTGTDFNSTDFYEVTEFENRAFSKKMYLFPIAQTEMDRNKSMVQNPGW